MKRKLTVMREPLKSLGLDRLPDLLSILKLLKFFEKPIDLQYPKWQALVVATGQRLFSPLLLKFVFYNFNS